MKIGHASHPGYRQGGFTLVESAAGLLVAATLFCVALPSMGRLSTQYGLATAQLDLISSLKHARYLAITSGRATLLCPSTDGRQCVSDTHWEHGWALGSYRSTRANQLDGAPRLVSTGYANLLVVSTEGRTRIRFQPDGTAGGSNTTFVLCRPGHPTDALALTVSLGGRVAASKAGAAQASLCAASG